MKTGGLTAKQTKETKKTSPLIGANQTLINDSLHSY
jgi:hypothetical protein